MRIGPQLYGFRGFEIAPAQAAIIAVPRVSAEQSNRLAIALPDLEAPPKMAVPNDPATLTKAQVTGLISQRLQENLIVNTTPAIEQLLRINLSLFKSNLDLEG